MRKGKDQGFGLLHVMLAMPRSSWVWSTGELEAEELHLGVCQHIYDVKAKRLDEINNRLILNNEKIVCCAL